MKWINERGWYNYVLEKCDANLGRNETNILATICSEKRTRVFSGMKVRRLTKPRFKLWIGDLGGHLYFKRLKDAKEFAEKTFEWMTTLKEIEA